VLRRLPGNLDPATLDGPNGFRISGVAEYDYARQAISGSVDMEWRCVR